MSDKLIIESPIEAGSINPKITAAIKDTAPVLMMADKIERIK